VCERGWHDLASYGSRAGCAAKRPPPREARSSHEAESVDGESGGRRWRSAGSVGCGRAVGAGRLHTRAVADAGRTNLRERARGRDRRAVPDDHRAQRRGRQGRDVSRRSPGAATGRCAEAGRAGGAHPSRRRFRIGSGHTDRTVGGGRRGARSNGHRTCRPATSRAHRHGIHAGQARAAHPGPTRATRPFSGGQSGCCQSGAKPPTHTAADGHRGAAARSAPRPQFRPAPESSARSPRRARPQRAGAEPDSDTHTPAPRLTYRVQLSAIATLSRRPSAQAAGRPGAVSS
jgi:hypothetical protein